MCECKMYGCKCGEFSLGGTSSIHRYAYGEPVQGEEFGK